MTLLPIFKYSYFLVKISLHVHYVLPMARLVIPLRGPARSSAALHDGLLRTLLFCNHAYWPIIHSRSSCSLIWNATTSTLSISAANSTVCVFFGHPVTFGLMSTFLSLVCPARIWSTCLPCFVFPAFGSMVGAHAESTASSIQCPKVRNLHPHPHLCILPTSTHSLRSILLTLFPLQSHVPKPHLRCNGNLPNASTTQEGELHQARVLPHLLLLLSIPVHSRSPLVLKLVRPPPYVFFALSAFVPVM